MLVLIDRTDVVSKSCSRGPLGFCQPKPITGSRKCVVHRQGIETLTAAAAGPYEIHGTLFASIALSPHHISKDMSSQTTPGGCRGAANRGLWRRMVLIIGYGRSAPFHHICTTDGTAPKYGCGSFAGMLNRGMNLAKEKA
jgi:hypothetical protein